MTKKPTITETETKILEYVRIQGITSEDEIADSLNLHIIDVLNALYGLEKKGIVKRVEGSPLGN
jgi:DNA-binding MarR family transcriptional regulator